MNTGIRFDVNALVDILLIVSVFLISREKMIQEQNQNTQPVVLKRKAFSKLVQEKVLSRQANRCNDCSEFLAYPEFHHKDGNRSNNSSWNCVALCPNCHAKITRKARR